MNADELQLYNASKAGDVEEVKAVLTATPNVDVNKQTPHDVRWIWCDDTSIKNTLSSEAINGGVGLHHSTDFDCQRRPRCCGENIAETWC